MIKSTAKSHTSLPRFTIIDEGNARQDLVQRREMKFTLAAADIGKLRTLLSTSGKRLIHNETISKVRSIYFDDARLSACRANLDGIGQRSKLRLRWYDSMSPSTDFYVEVKWRDNRVTGKHRLQMTSDTPLSELSYREIAGGLARTLPTGYQRFLAMYDRPVVTVEYSREHFASREGAMRMTLDYDLTYYDQTGKHRVNTSFPLRLGGLIVIEAKTQIGQEREVREMLFPLSYRASRCSKYVMGCRKIGLIPSGDV